MDDQQHEGVAPLLHPAVLVVTNCETCRGTGYVVGRAGGSDAPWDGRDPLTADVPNNTVLHEDCDGSGRVVREMELPEFAQLVHECLRAALAVPSPSELRGELHG